MAAFCVCRNGLLRLILIKCTNETAFESEKQKKYPLLQDLNFIYIFIYVYKM